MKKIYLLIFIMTILLSCSKEEELDPQFSDPSNMSKNLKVSKLDLALNDSIVPLNSEDFPDIKNNTHSLRNSSVFSELFQLDGISFYIKSKNSYFGKNTLQSTGKGNEVILATHSETNEAQLFYLEFLPASSGIPYLIYSYKEQSPIGAGSYASDPDNYVLYTQASGSSNLFGFSWDFYQNANNDGYIIENQDIIGSGPGGPWDIFYYALQSRSGNLDFIKRNNSSIYQQFNFIPNDEFTIEEVTLDYNNTNITGTVPLLLKTGTFINETTNNATEGLNLSVTNEEGTSFDESSGISTSKTGNVNVGISIFDVVEIGGSYTIQQGQQETVQYGENSSRTITSTDSYSFIVPPNTSVSYKYMAMSHSVDIGYTAKLKGVETEKIMNITGIYEGVDYSSRYLEITETPLNNRSTRKSKTYIVSLD